MMPNWRFTRTEACYKVKSSNTSFVLKRIPHFIQWGFFSSLDFQLKLDIAIYTVCINTLFAAAAMMKLC